MKCFQRINLKLFIILLVLQTSDLLADNTQQVYEYKNKDGVTEFTDQLKQDKEIVSESKIKKMTPEQEAESKAQLEAIVEKDKELDKQRALRNQLEKERRLRLQKEKELEQLKKEQAEESEKDKNSGDIYWRTRPKRYPPVRPEQPIHRPPKPRPPRPQPLPR